MKNKSQVMTGVMILLNSCLALAEMKIQTQPLGAKVYSFNEKEEKELIGETPLDLPAPLAGKKIVVEKPGFSPAYLFLPEDLSNQVQMSINLIPLSEWSTDVIKSYISEATLKNVDQIVYLQALLDERKLDTARPLIDEFRKNYPASVAGKILFANYLLLSGNTQESLEQFDKISSELKPDQQYLKDLVDKMSSYLKKKPASL